MIYDIKDSCPHCGSILFKVFSHKEECAGCNTYYREVLEKPEDPTFIHVFNMSIEVTLEEEE